MEKKKAANDRTQEVMQEMVKFYLSQKLLQSCEIAQPLQIAEESMEMVTLVCVRCDA